MKIFFTHFAMKKQITYFLFSLTLILASGISKINAQPFGGFINFDGVDDQLQVAGTPIPEFNDFTIEFWYESCQDSTSLAQVFLENGEFINANINKHPISMDDYFSLCLQYDNLNLTCWEHLVYTPQPLWHHVAITYDYALDEFNFYFDGTGSWAGTQENFSYIPDPLLTVGFCTFETWNYEYFNGYIDEMRISDVIRYYGPFTPPSTEFTNDPNTICLWHFNDNNPITSVLDASGNGFNFGQTGNPIIIHLDSLITQNLFDLTVSGSFDSYQWIDCDNGNVPIPGETIQVFTPSTMGNYSVQVSNASCSITSECYFFNLERVDDNKNDFCALVFPNPADNQITISTNSEGTKQLILTDVLGQTVFSAVTTSKNAIVDCSNFAPGVYFIILLNGNGEKETMKFIKE